MDRRRFLAVLGAAGTVGLAGCSTGFDGDSSLGGSTATPTDTPTGTSTSTSTSTPTPVSRSVGDLELPVPRDQLQRGAPEDAIPAITDPKFASDWSGLEINHSSRFGGEETIEPRLNPDDLVIGVQRGGEARAYPLRVLNWHEIVNDTLDGPLLVTYCPLCGSAMTAVRTVNGEETVFGVSGLLFRSDLVMYDRETRSLWSQIVATAIRGPKTGTQLSLVPSTLTTWEAWRTDHPDTVVLLPAPKSDTVAGEVTRDYTYNPYTGYEESKQIGIGGGDDYEGELHPKTLVVGVANDGVARAYPLGAVRKAGVVNDEVGGLPVVVALGPGDTLVAYERTVEGETLTFERADDRHLAAGGSRWRTLTGEAVDGPFEGTRLAQANDISPEFFFAWKNFHSDTEVYGTDGN